MKSNIQWECTLVLLNYNNYRYVPRCIDSIIASGIFWKKIVFIDDQSTDREFSDYVSLVDKFSIPNLSIRRNNTNLGVKGSLESFIEEDGAGFIQLLATDDFFLSTPKALPILKKDHVYLSCGCYVNSEGNIGEPYIQRFLSDRWKGQDLSRLIYYSNPVKAPGLVVHSDFALKALESSNVNFEDWPVVRAAVAAGLRFSDLTGFEVGYQQNDKSITGSKDPLSRQWLQAQKIIFLKESLEFPVDKYTKFMTRVQLMALGTSPLCRIAARAIRFLDYRRWFMQL